MKTDDALLQAALFGYQVQIAEMERAMAEIRRKLSVSGGGNAVPAKTGRRKLSAAARKRISAAQKKRWAEYKKEKGQ